MSSPLCALGNCVAACPDGARATVGELLDDPEVRLLGPGGGALRTVPIRGSQLCAQAWSPDGRMLFVASRTALHALDAEHGYAEVASMALSFIALTLSTAAGPQPGSYTLAVGGGPGLLMCSCEGAPPGREGDGERTQRAPHTLRASRSFRTSGGPLCCAAFDSTGAWLACATMNGLLTLAHASSLGERPERPGGQGEASDGHISTGHELTFASRLAAQFGVVLSGTRPTSLAWAPDGLRLLVGCWDGSVDLLEGTGEGHVPGLTGRSAQPPAPAEAEVSWRLRGARASDGPVDAAFCAPQLCWAPGGLAFCVAAQQRAPHSAVAAPARATLHVVLAPPRQLCGMADAVVARVSLDEPLAGIAACGYRPARPGPAERPAPGEAEAHLLLVGLSGAVRLVRLPSVALLSPAHAHGQVLCRSEGEQVSLWAERADRPADGGTGGRDGPGRPALSWHLVVTPADAPASAPSELAPSGDAGPLGAPPRRPPCGAEERHALASALHLDWLDLAEAVAHASARPWARESGSGGWGVRVSVSRGALLLARSNALFWRWRGAQPGAALEREADEAAGCGAWRMLVAPERIGACCACGAEGRHAALLGSNGALSVWCLASARCLRRVLLPDAAGWGARACLALCAHVRAGGGDGDASQAVVVRAALADFSRGALACAAGATGADRCGAGPARRAEREGDEHGRARRVEEGVIAVRLVCISHEEGERTGEWRERAAPRECTPASAAGLHGAAAIAFRCAEAAEGGSGQERSSGEQSPPEGCGRGAAGDGAARTSVLEAAPHGGARLILVDVLDADPG